MSLRLLKQQHPRSIKYILATSTSPPYKPLYFLYSPNALKFSASLEYSTHTTPNNSAMAPDWKKQAKAARATANAQSKSSRPHNSQQKKPALTHFLCLPLVTPASKPALKASMDRFKAEASSLTALDANVKSLLTQRSLRAVGTLHLTLGVMSLQDVAKLDEAVQLLSDIDIPTMLRDSARAAANPTVAGENGSQQHASMQSTPSNDTASSNAAEPVYASLVSLKAMRSPTRTSALYADPVDQTGRLQHFCEALRAAFVEKGLVLDENRPLRLHATVLNSIYGKPVPRGRRDAETARPAVKQEDDGEDDGDGDDGKQDSEADVGGGRDGDQKDGKPGDGQGGSRDKSRREQHRRRRPGPLLFDATPLLDHFEDFEWADAVRLERIAICKMVADRVCDDAGNTIDELYEEVAVRKLP